MDRAMPSSEAPASRSWSPAAARRAHAERAAARALERSTGRRTRLVRLSAARAPPSAVSSRSGGASPGCGAWSGTRSGVRCRRFRRRAPTAPAPSSMPRGGAARCTPRVRSGAGTYFCHRATGPARELAWPPTAAEAARWSRRTGPSRRASRGLGHACRAACRRGHRPASTESSLAISRAAGGCYAVCEGVNLQPEPDSASTTPAARAAARVAIATWWPGATLRGGSARDRRFRRRLHPFPTLLLSLTVRILVAPLEFKGSLTAGQAARAIEAGVRAGLARGRGGRAPARGRRTGNRRRAGGGAGRAMAHRLGARRARTTARGAVGELARRGRGGDGPRLRPLAAGSRGAERAGVTSTLGTGELIADALETGIRSLLIGVGGSATNDGGMGALQALGYRFLDASGRALPPGGAALRKLARIVPDGILPAVRETEMTVMTDVLNPLCGPTGASHVYGPQKGASPEDVELLDAALVHLAEVVRRDLGVDAAHLPGTGAAGGLSYGLLVGCGARISRGLRAPGEAPRAGREAPGAWTGCSPARGGSTPRRSAGRDRWSWPGGRGSRARRGWWPSQGRSTLAPWRETIRSGGHPGEPPGMERGGSGGPRRRGGPAHLRGRAVGAPYRAGELIVTSRDRRDRAATEGLDPLRGVPELARVVGLAPADHLVGLGAVVDLGDLHLALPLAGHLLVGEEVVLKPVHHRRAELCAMSLRVAVGEVRSSTAMILSSASLPSIIRSPPMGTARTQQVTAG